MPRDAIESILVNYSVLFDLWDECLQSRVILDPHVKARIIGVQHQMYLFSLLFGFKFCECLLKTTDNLSRSLQSTPLSSAEAQHIASLTTRTDDAYQAFYQLIKSLSGTYYVQHPCLPRKRKYQGDMMKVLAMGTSIKQLKITVEGKALDLAVANIKGSISLEMLCIEFGGSFSEWSSWQ